MNTADWSNLIKSPVRHKSKSATQNHVVREVSVIFGR